MKNQIKVFGTALIVAVCITFFATDVQAQAPLKPSDNWASSMTTGPDANIKITEAYATAVTKEAYFWAWSMMNIYTRKLTFEKVPEIMMQGPLPVAPPNRLGMLTDYIAWNERHVACPNQDVVYGGSSLDLKKSPVIVQVPDFGKRFWVFAGYDLRTDEFTQIGSMYNSRPGFYMLVGPEWNGEVPKGVEQVVRSKTNTGFIVCRVFLDDTKEDRVAIQPVVNQITIYPLAEFDGKFKINDWSKLKKVPDGPSSNMESQWVFPERFLETLPLVLDDSPCLPGEEARYAQLRALIEATKKDPKIKDAVLKAAADAEKEIVLPLLQFRSWGVQLPHNWSTLNNNAVFGTDYFSRTAAARANIFVNSPRETKYYYQDLDAEGVRLNGSKSYTITFPKGQTPPVSGFWSLTLYNQYHFFANNDIGRYSLGTKNKDLKYNADGSLTLYIQADAPEKSKHNNWLPSPKGEDFSLYIRAYEGKAEVLNGVWTPPAVLQVK